jgi:hypothetical protein
VGPGGLNHASGGELARQPVEARSQLDRKAHVALLPQVPHSGLLAGQRQKAFKIVGRLRQVARPPAVEDGDEQAVRRRQRSRPARETSKAIPQEGREKDRGLLWQSRPQQCPCGSGTVLAGGRGVTLPSGRGKPHRT